MRAYPTVIGLVLLSFSCALAAHEREPPRYRLVKLEDANAGMETLIPRALNNFGSITGAASISADPFRTAYLWRKQQLSALESDGSITPTEGSGINDLGQVVGSAVVTDAATGVRLPHGFVWTRGKLTEIGDLPGGNDSSSASDINLWGQVTGGSVSAAGLEAVLWQGGNLMSIGDLPGGITEANGSAINDWGVIVGEGNSDAGFRPFFWWRGTMKELPVPDGMEFGRAADVNNFNVVVGLAGVAGEGFLVKPLLWQPRRPVKVLPIAPGFTSGHADGINDFGDVVGTSLALGGASVATLWHRGVAYDLNTLIADDDPLKPCMTLAFGRAINERGEIAAQGFNLCENDFQITFLLEPIRHKHRHR